MFSSVFGHTRSTSWKINTCNSDNANAESFIGGKPKLPADLRMPKCSLCGEHETFFFQIAFPFEGHWAGKTLAIFSCTACCDTGHVIPEMSKLPLKGLDIPVDFLEQYQTNFNMEIFDTESGVIRNDCAEIIVFQGLEIIRGKGMGDFGKLGGVPIWLLDDETPTSYNVKTPMQFLLQTRFDFEFAKSARAPRQKIFSYFKNEVVDKYTDEYSLFLGNAGYYFGTVQEQHLVYIITQVD